MKIILNEDIYISRLDLTFPKNVEISVCTYKNAKLMLHPEKVGMLATLPSKGKYSIV